MNLTKKNCSFTLIFALILFALVLICHGLSLKAPFMVDDFYYVNAVNIPHFDFLTELNLRQKNPGHHFHPLDQIVNTFLFSVFHQPISFYALNLIIFFINAFLLFFTVKLISKCSKTAFMAAVLFAIHPFNAEVLCHATFSTVLLTAVFLQLSLIWFLRNFLNQEISNTYLCLSLLSYILALFYLETSLLFPLYLTALCFFYPNFPRKKVLKFTWLYWMLSFLYFGLWIYNVNINHHLSYKFKFLNMTFASYTATISFLLHWYFKNLIFPDEIVLMKNSLPLSSSILLWNGLFVFAIAALFFLLLRWRNTLKGFAFAWFVLGFIFMPPSCAIHAFSMGLVIEPYWFYFSSMGFFMLFALLLWELKQKVGFLLWRALLITIVLFWGIVSYRQHIIGRTEIGYLEYWLQKCPDNFMPSILLGSLYGYSEESTIPETLIPLMSRQADVFINFDQPFPAARLLEKLLTQVPENPNHKVWEYTLTGLYFKTDEITKAENRLELFLSQLYPQNDYILMAQTLNRLNLREKALKVVNNGLQYYPNDPDLTLFKVVTLANENRFEEAKDIVNSNYNDPRFLTILNEIKKIEKNVEVPLPSTN